MYDSHAINDFASFINYMSCSSQTNITTGGSNGCADQLTNWDGTQKIELGGSAKEETWNVTVVMYLHGTQLL